MLRPDIKPTVLYSARPGLTVVLPIHDESVHGGKLVTGRLLGWLPADVVSVRPSTVRPAGRMEVKYRPYSTVNHVRAPHSGFSHQRTYCCDPQAVNFLHAVPDAVILPPKGRIITIR